MQKNACLLAKIDADTAENEQHLAENLPKKLTRGVDARRGPLGGHGVLGRLPRLRPALDERAGGLRPLAVYLLPGLG